MFYKSGNKVISNGHKQVCLQTEKRIQVLQLSIQTTVQEDKLPVPYQFQKQFQCHYKQPPLPILCVTEYLMYFLGISLKTGTTYMDF